MSSYDNLVSSVEDDKGTPMPEVRAKLGAAEQVYADAIQDFAS